MAYSTAQKMLDHFGARELAEVGTPHDLTAITADILRDQVSDADMSGYTAGEQAAALACETRITEAIAAADSEIDMSLRSAGYELPLASVPAIIESSSEDIARFDLHKERPTEAITTRYREALKRLDRIATGKLSLDIGMSSSSGVDVSAPTQVFSDSAVWNDYF